MRFLLLLAVVLVLALAGLIGFVVHKECQRGRSGSLTTTGTSASTQTVETISNGERVDIDAHIPREGFTVVEFSADF
ncbi:MAG: hypothetical protein K8J09_11240 [Planctomycetes bacterium]|nr:hypothetical protein [Planctomycetota bacterium]MCC7399633.1 hypothetical protein [Planctomycetota bacterium]